MNKLSLNTYIETLTQQAKNHITEYIEMLYIQAKSTKNRESVKYIDKKSIENYLEKRGYTMNYVLGKKVMVKGFTVVSTNKTEVEVWHDKIKNNKSVFVKESLLTGLPITLDYMERL